MLSVNFEIAKTHLLAKPRQTLIAMLGVTFGIGMYILMISFMEGFTEFLEDTLLSSTPDVRLYNDINTDYTHSILDEISDTAKVLNIVHHPKPKEVTPNIKNAGKISRPPIAIRRFKKSPANSRKGRKRIKIRNPPAIHFPCGKIDRCLFLSK